MHRTKILIAEDDAIISMELEERLQALGYGVCAVTVSGKDAIEQAARKAGKAGGWDRAKG